MKESEKSKKITHAGELDLNGILIPCYVLEDGTRVLSGRGLQDALKLSDDTAKAEKRSGSKVGRLLANQTLKPLIYKDKALDHYRPIASYQGRQYISAYESTILVDLCDAMLEARKNGLLKTDRQRIIADQCEILVRSLAKVGIVALVDEATGYQYDREKDELQKILKAYISEELLKWQKRFPNEFYKEIFRLNGWGELTVSGIRAHQRPGVIGTWTKKLVYQQLPKGVIQELYNKTPKNNSGKLSKKLHQSLTLDIGQSHLEKQLVSVITLMNISKDWKEFIKFFNKKFGQQEIEFGSDEQRNMIEPKDKPITNNDFNKSLGGLLNVPPPPKEDKEDESDDDKEEDDNGAELEPKK